MCIRDRYYIRRIVLPELGGYEAALTPYVNFTSAWPSSGPLGDPFSPMHAGGIPAVNTLLLLTSGATLTWAHWGLIKNSRSQLTWGLALTVLLGTTFMCFQVYEYAHASVSYTHLDVYKRQHHHVHLAAAGSAVFLLDCHHLAWFLVV